MAPNLKIIHPGQRAFFTALQTGEITVLSNLIAQRKFLVHGSFKSKRLPPLVEAVKAKSAPVVRLLLELGVDVNMWMGMPILEATKCGDIDVVALLLEYGADVDRSPGTPALEWAVMQDNYNIAEVLLRFGADPNTGYILSKAIERKNCAMVKLLLNNNAKITTDYYLNLRFAVDMAVAGNQEILLILLDNVQKLEDKEVVRSYDVNIVPKLRRYAELLSAIVEHNNVKVANLLVKADYATYATVLEHPTEGSPAYVLRRCQDGYLPSHLAVKLGDLGVIKTFQEARVDLENIFWESVRTGNLDVLQELNFETLGFDPRNSRDQEDKTALHVACELKFVNVAEILVNKYGL